MSKDLVKQDAGSRVLGAMKADYTTAALGAGAVAATLMIPGIGWMIGAGLGAVIGYRAVRRGLSRS